MRDKPLAQWSLSTSLPAPSAFLHYNTYTNTSQTPSQGRILGITGLSLGDLDKLYDFGEHLASFLGLLWEGNLVFLVRIFTHAADLPNSTPATGLLANMFFTWDFAN